MSVAMVAGGLFAYTFLPVAALPRTEFPVINVSASLPGASPDTMATSVATPLIKQFTTIAGIDTITSSSAQSQTQIAIQFNLDRNIDAAAADVQAAIARTQRQLPAEMTDPPSYRKVNPADAPILLMSIRSDTTPLSKLDAFAQQVISPALSTIEGVAQVMIYGSQKYAVRVQLDPNALASRGIGVNEVQQAITAANANTPVGALQNPDQRLTIQAETQLANAAQFSNIIIAVRNGRPVRLGDVAKVIDSVENYQQASWYDGTRSIVLAVQRQPDANTVEVVDRVKALMPTFEAQLPPNTTIHTLNDRSISIRHAVEDVKFTLGLTIALVIMVIFVFLRRVSATIIPSLAVPISIVATLGAMYLFGFSIDNISLLGLTLSVGLVVDDAIVMLENIFRHMEEEGKGPMEASLDGSREIGLTIISITLSLVAVFLPVLLMGGVIGRIFNEFAVVVTASIAASAFVSLTLTPMLCSRILSQPDHGHDNRKGIGGWLEKGFDKFLAGYDWGLRFSLRHQFFMLLVFFGTLGGTVWLFMSIPKGFFPQEDIGQLMVTTEARQDISFDSMVTLQKEVMKVFQKSPYVAHVASTAGVATSGGGPNSGMNSGRLFVELKPQEYRPPLSVVLPALRKQLAQVAGINTYMVPVQNLNIGGRISKSQYQYVMQAIDQNELYSWSQKMADAMQKDPAFADVSTDLQNNALQATLKVDRDKANSLGISADQLRSTLYSGFGARQVSTIYTAGDSYSVLIEFDPSIAWTSDRLDVIRIRAANGTLVPLSSFARVERTAGPLTVNQLGQLTAVTLSFNLPNGVSLGDAINRIDQLKAQMQMPVTIATSFAGTAKTFQQSLANQGILLTAAIVTIYIVLGILYESFVHPLTILTGLPSAALGALATLKLFGMDLSVIAMIGLLMLIGIVKKNAIMMIDVALVMQRDGKAPKEAIYEACLVRFRPIMMTTFAAIMGTLPIALGAGAGAELRQPLGVAVVGGLVVSQALTLFITPVLYLYMDRLSNALLGLGAWFRKPRQAREHRPEAQGSERPMPAE
ncbi:acriflavine resistance protein B [Alsobacter soli]|uniref:Acriflavine resistance protein B n=1 Tax=Alsobacter soli TaxID=2109933 RepID=A0A2T1HQF0_9HYPH|nr:acriflavine resistance protein B [Alsobacter soli]